jgi:uncharacterized protein YdeI (YjbR/CyaY-like superfamily)
MPASVRRALAERQLLAAYRARPAYQQNDYLGWIGRAQRPETKDKRLRQMLTELAQGDTYMKMKHPASAPSRKPDLTVDEFVETKVRPEFRPIAAALRKLVRTCAPQAREAICYGILAFRGRRILAVMNPTKNGITFAFTRGAEFEDPHGLLAGVGRVSKHVRLRTVADINPAALRHYLRQALAFDRQP